MSVPDATLLTEAREALGDLKTRWDAYITALNDGTDLERVRQLRWSVATAAGNIVDNGTVVSALNALDQAQRDVERLDDERKSWRALALHVGQLLTPYEDGEPLEGWEDVADAMNDTEDEALAWAKKHLIQIHAALAERGGET